MERVLLTLPPRAPQVASLLWRVSFCGAPHLRLAVPRWGRRQAGACQWEEAGHSGLVPVCAPQPTLPVAFYPAGQNRSVIAARFLMSMGHRLRVRGTDVAVGIGRHAR